KRQLFGRRMIRFRGGKGIASAMNEKLLPLRSRLASLRPCASPAISQSPYLHFFTSSSQLSSLRPLSAPWSPPPLSSYTRHTSFDNDRAKDRPRRCRPRTSRAGFHRL